MKWLRFREFKQKFGSIKRVDKGWITTVKDLESWRFERQSEWEFEENLEFRAFVHKPPKNNYEKS